MPDNTKQPEQSADMGQATDKIADLPTKPVDDREAQAIKGGRDKLPVTPKGIPV